MQGAIRRSQCFKWFNGADVQDDKGPIPLNNVSMNVLKKVTRLDNHF